LIGRRIKHPAERGCHAVRRSRRRTSR
jgi:hypothetical protein